MSSSLSGISSEFPDNNCSLIADTYHINYNLQRIDCNQVFGKEQRISLTTDLRHDCNLINVHSGIPQLKLIIWGLIKSDSLMCPFQFEQST